MPEEFLTVQDLCRRLRLSKPTVLELIHHPDPEKRLASLRVGIQLRVRADDFEEWFLRNRTDGKVKVRNTQHRGSGSGAGDAQPGRGN